MQNLKASKFTAPADYAVRESSAPRSYLNLGVEGPRSGGLCGRGRATIKSTEASIEKSRKRAMGADGDADKVCPPLL
jgi:hypothetical protein